MCASYRDKSRSTDFENHANKIFTAIREINPEYAEKRAIWELFQNALDIVEDKGKIRISKTDKGFKFEHNGRPFNDGNLTGLIKQSSNGKTYGSNQNEIGQYGTGFLSTHVYGKKILINASVQTDIGLIKRLDDFTIERNADSPDALKLKIQEQDDNAAKICDENGFEISEHLEFTSFEYIESESSKQNINNMFEYIPSILPFIFTFNDKLHTVEVNYKGESTTYCRNRICDSILDLSINEKPLNFSFLSDIDNNIKIILPQNGLNFQEVPKLFLYYPMMETVDLGINFLIHAQEFKPNKERDYLFLEATNEELKVDSEINKKLLDRAFKLIIDKVKTDTTLDFLPIIKINFKENEDPYLKEKKENFVNSIKELERIKINEDKVSLISISYLHEDILELDEEVVKAIYDVLMQFYTLPKYDVYIYLSTLVNNWQNESFSLLHYKDILDKVYQETKGNYENVFNKESYKTLIKSVSSDVELLNESKAVPNIHNKFSSIIELKKWDKIEDSLIKTMDTINCDISCNYLHKEFYFLENISPYTRENFKDDLNKFNGETIIQLEKDEHKINYTKYHSLISTLIYFISLNKVTESNKKFKDFYTRQYELPETEESLDNPTVTLNYDSSFKLIARLYIKDVSQKGSEFIKENIESIKDFIDILYSNSELKKNLLDKLSCFPSQLYGLKPQNELKKDLIKDDEFKNKYLDIIGENIKEKLILSEFESYISHENSINGSFLGDKIETKLSSNKEFFPIKNNDIIEVLLNLIKYIAKPNSKWNYWLPNINKVKEEILMTKFKDENTRLSLFNILSESKEKINLLGDLAQIEDLDGLIKAGKEKQKEERRQNNHLEYIKIIGLKIQDLVQEKLDSSLAETIKIIESNSDEKLTTIEEQNGQDFIIYKSGVPVYYIEVKSRWDADGIVALSKRQVERCSQNKEIYAVITVNVADYKSRNKIIEENVSFEDLSQDIYVNTDLGTNFEVLIKENMQFETIKENTKLIEFRGHIPQQRIKSKGINFDEFIGELKSILTKNTSHD